MGSVAPPLKLRKLIVVMAFDRRKGGELKMVRVPQLFDSEERAIRKAEELAPYHVGVVAWSREAIPDVGEYGPPTTLFVDGDVPAIRKPTK
jgi:hypothetical protein